MKTLSSISLFIFGVVVTAILTAGLVFYQNNKVADSQVSGSKVSIATQEKIKQATSAVKSDQTTTTTVKSNSTTPTVTNNQTTSTPSNNSTVPTAKSLVLNMAEISKHNSSSDCWMLISGKVYDITNFFGSHPGGNRVMAQTCGTNATDAYLTKDPNAKSASGGRNHSSNARSMLTDYYIGNLNQSIKQ